MPRTHVWCFTLNLLARKQIWSKLPFSRWLEVWVLGISVCSDVFAKDFAITEKENRRKFLTKHSFLITDGEDFISLSLVLQSCCGVEWIVLPSCMTDNLLCRWHLQLCMWLEIVERYSTSNILQRWIYRSLKYTDSFLIAHTGT